MNEMIKIGEIDGKFIYHDKYCKEGQYTMCRKGKDLLDKGLIYLPYTPEQVANMIEENKRTPPERNYDNYYETIRFVVGKSENLEDYKIVLEQIKNKNVVEE